MSGGFNISLVGQWTPATLVLMTSARRIKAASDKALLQGAHYIRKQIVQGMRDQAPGGLAFKPLKPATIAARKSEGFTGTKALIRSGDLRNAIQVTRIRSGIVFIGVLRTVRGNTGGQLLANIAQIHEFGAPGAHIPARPFIRPVIEAERENIRDMFLNNFAKNLGGVFGGP